MKRIISFLTVLFVLVASFSLAIPAGAAADSAGYSDSRVTAVDLSQIPDIRTLEQATDIGFDTVAYAAGTAWKIADAAGLQLFSKIANTQNYPFYEKTVYLADDIDMIGVTGFEPIGNDRRVASGGVVDNTVFFRGIFDGQGHRIKNLVMTSSADGAVGVALFGSVRGAVIRNLIIDSSCSFSYTGSSTEARTAGVAAYTFSHGGDKHIGLVEGTADVHITYRIDNVKNEATVRASAGYAGGIIGVAAGATGYVPYVTGCTNTGTVEGVFGAAGIIGSVLTRKMTVIDCLSTGDITARDVAAAILVNRVPDTNPTVVTGCRAAGTVTGEKIGGLLISTGKAAITETDCNGSDVRLVQKTAEKYLGFTDTELEYTGTVGYSAERVEKADLKDVLPICTFLDAPTDCVTFKISTPTDLSVFAELVNSGATMQGMTVYLENDINMSGVGMRPIGSPANDVTKDKNASNYFAGTFDGQGHVIDNLVIEQDAGTGEKGEFVVTGLFGIIRSATLKNVVLGSGCRFAYTGPSESYCAALVGMIYRLPVTTESYSVIDNCLTAATVTGTKSAGGIAAMVEGNNNNFSHVLRNCTNMGEVSSEIYSSGIVCYINNRRIDIENCRNIGKITLDAEAATESSGAAGICARPNSNQAVNIRSCINNGEIVGPGTLGGIVAIENHTTVKIDSCSNYGKLTCTTANKNVGPVYGLLAATSCDHMTNNADATGKADKTLVIPTVETNFPNYAPIDEAHDKLFPDDDGGDDDKPTEEEPTEEKPTGEKPTDEKPTDQEPTQTDKPSEDKKGCASAVSLGGAVTLLLIGAAGVAFRKKESE